MKPTCRLCGSRGTMFSVLFRVRDKLREANLERQVEEFLKRAQV